MAKVWRPVKLGVHELRKPSGELRGHLTLTPVRLGWLNALDDNYTEIVWGKEYRVCELVNEDVATVSMTPTQREEVIAALQVAAQLAEVASDWNLDEVEIDGVMVETFDVGKRMKELADELGAQVHPK